jgi:serine protease DegQ
MTLKRLWLVFAQATTVALGVLFVITTLKPEWLATARDDPAPIVVKQVPAAGISDAKSSSYHDAVARAAPAVVNVFTSSTAKAPRHPFADDPLFRRFFGEGPDQPQRASSLGSGVIVSPQGYVLTNNHVIEGMDEIEVLLADNSRLKAKVVGVDPETDLAVLKVDRAELPSITFGQLETVRIGDVVLAIGNPFGVGQTVTMGIVSALGRRGLNINTYENFIQTDASINPGNSGGPLVDTGGNLIGINTAIFSRTGGSLGIGFAIPASTVKTVLEQIVADGSVTRGYIGVQAQAVTPEVSDSLKLGVMTGVLIAGVERNGPADKAGVKPGDVLVGVNGKSTPDPAAMLDAVAELAPGSQATLRLRRADKDVEAGVTVGKRPPVRRPR